MKFKETESYLIFKSSIEIPGERDRIIVDIYIDKFSIKHFLDPSFLIKFPTPIDTIAVNTEEMRVLSLQINVICAAYLED